MGDCVLEVCIHFVSEDSVGIHPIHPVLSQKLAGRPCVACSLFFYLACLFISNSPIPLIRKLGSDICGGRASFCCLDCLYPSETRILPYYVELQENSQSTDDYCSRTQAVLLGASASHRHLYHNTLTHKVCLFSREIEEKFSLSNKGIKKFDKLNLYLLSHFTKQEINSEPKVLRQALPVKNFLRDALPCH